MKQANLGHWSVYTDYALGGNKKKTITKDNVDASLAKKIRSHANNKKVSSLNRRFGRDRKWAVPMKWGHRGVTVVSQS